jgi:flavin-dependent dehydrogenase
MNHTVKAVIIGAGPAGTSCAYMLQKSGVACVLVDFATFPREKVCGGGLTPKAYKLLEDIFPGIEYTYKSIGKIKLSIDHRSPKMIEVPEPIRLVNRKDFDNTLLQQYLQIGGQFIQDAFSSFTVAQDNTITVTLKSGKQLHCNYLVGADGANSRVRKQVVGNYHGNVLCLEQRIAERSDVIEGVISNEYKNGYYYLFPSIGCDIVGLGSANVTLQQFREVLDKLGIQETKINGANIPVEEVDSGMDNVILIGDAGGFPNKMTYEGLYYAFATGRNAAEAILTGKSFRETNKDILRRKRKERILTDLLYRPSSIRLLRYLTHCNSLMRKLFVAGLSK